MKRFTFILMAILLLSACRTAKPTISSELTLDSTAVSTDSTFSLCHDSVSISESEVIKTEDKVEFIKEGGKIYVSSAGSVILSGVAGIKYSSSCTSEGKKTKDSMSITSQSKDSVATIHQSFAHSESQLTPASDKWSWKAKCAAIALALLLLLILLPELRQKFNL